MNDDDLDIKVADAIDRIAAAAEQMAKNGRDMLTIAGMIKAPVMSDRDAHRAHAWLNIYGSALNCLGVNSADARNAADKGLRFYEERFLKE